MQSSILAKCRCGQKYNLPAKYAGGRLPCKHCDSFFRVPLTRPADEVPVKLFCGHTFKVRDCDIEPKITCPKCKREMKINLKSNAHLCERVIYHKVTFEGEGQRGAKPVRAHSLLEKRIKREKPGKHNPSGLLVVERDAIYFFQTKVKSMKKPEDLFYARSGFSTGRMVKKSVNDLFMQLFYIADINTVIEEFSEFYGKCMIFPRDEFSMEMIRIDAAEVKTSKREYKYWKNSEFPYPKEVEFQSSHIKLESKEYHRFRFQAQTPPNELFDAMSALGYEQISLLGRCVTNIKVLTVGKGILLAYVRPSHTLECYTEYTEIIEKRLK